MTAEEDPFAPDVAMLRMTHFEVQVFKLTHHRPIGFLERMPTQLRP
jgi:hypothetical protein